MSAERERILLVDDEPRVLSALSRQLKRKYDVETAVSGRDALERVAEKGPFAVVLSDMRMPEMDGVEFLAQLRIAAPETVRLMLTGNADQETAKQAVNEGHVFRFLTKPCPGDELDEAIRAAVDHARLHRNEHELLERTLNGAIQVVTEILSLLDPEGFGAAQEVREDAGAVARALGAERTWEIELAAMLARLGSVTLPPELSVRARSGAALTASERALMDEVPAAGARLVNHIPRLEGVSEIVRLQARHFDGSGPPDDGPSGDELPLGARILDALAGLRQLEASNRTRAEALEALAVVRERYDPRVLEVLHELYAPPDVEEEQPPPLELALAQLIPGQVLAGAIETESGTRLLSAGHRITDAFLERLRNYERLAGIKTPILVEDRSTRGVRGRRKAG